MTGQVVDEIWKKAKIQNYNYSELSYNTIK